MNDQNDKENKLENIDTISFIDIDTNDNSETEKNVVQNSDSNDDSKEINSTINFVKNICIVLSVIVIIIGIYFMIASINAFSESRTDSLTGPLIGLFSLAGVIFIPSLTGFVVCIIWVVYVIIKSLIEQHEYSKTVTSYKKMSPEKKRKIIISIPFIIIFVILILLGIGKYNYSNKSLVKVLSNSNIDETNYVINKDKIYYYRGYSKPYDRLYMMDLNGKNNKLFKESDKLSWADFYLVYNDEAYYTDEVNENKKINLKTGEIKSLDKYTYLPLSKNKNFVYTFDNEEDENDNYTIIRKIDLNTNEVILSNKTKYNRYLHCLDTSCEDHYLDYSGVNIYYFDNSCYKCHPKIYKNEELIYEITEYTNSDFTNPNFIAINDNYIYIKQNNKIYKLDINNKSIEKEINYDIGNFERIISTNNQENYFYSNNNIYYFNIQKETFEILISGVDKKPEYIYKFNNKLIFMENMGNDYYNPKEDLGSVIIYDTNKKDINKYKNIRDTIFDDEKMYLIYESWNRYKIRPIELN